MGKNKFAELYRAKNARKTESEAPYNVNPNALLPIKLSCGDSKFFAAFYGIDISKNEVPKTREQILNEIDIMSPQAAQKLLLHYINCGNYPEQIKVFNVTK